MISNGCLFGFKLNYEFVEHFWYCELHNFRERLVFDKKLNKMVAFWGSLLLNGVNFTVNMAKLP